MHSPHIRKERNIHSLPRIANPVITARPCSNILALNNLLRQRTLFRLILIMQHKDRESRLLALTTRLLLHLANILLELADGILERRPGVIDLVDDENVLADQVANLQRRQVEPLGARDLGAGRLDGVGAEGLVQAEANGLDRDVGAAGLLQEGAERGVSSILVDWMQVGMELRLSYRRIRAGT